MQELSKKKTQKSAISAFVKYTVITICHRKWNAKDLTITADNTGVMPTLIARNLNSSSHQRLQALEDSGSPAYLPWHGRLTCICPSICHKISAACPECYCLSAVQLPQVFPHWFSSLLTILAHSCSLHLVWDCAAGLQTTEVNCFFLQNLQAMAYAPVQPLCSSAFSLFWPRSSWMNSTIKSEQHRHYPFIAAGWKTTFSGTTPTCIYHSSLHWHLSFLKHCETKPSFPLSVALDKSIS